MFHFPDPPPFSAIRYVKCISCDHIFPISEAAAPVNGEKPTKSWNVHTEQVGARDSVQAQARAAGRPLPATPHIICTRCQAENDNWVYMQQNPPTIFSWRFLKRARDLLVGFTITAVLVVLFGLLGFKEISELFHLVVYIATLLVVGALPFIWLPARWKTSRDRIYRKQSIPQTAGRSPTADLFIATILVFAVLMPIILYVGMPPYNRQWYNHFWEPVPSSAARLAMVEQRLTLTNLQQSPTARAALRNLVMLERAQTNICQNAALQTVERNLLRIQNQPLPTAVSTDINATLNEVVRVQQLSNGDCSLDLIYRLQGLLSELAHDSTVAPGETVQPLPDCNGEIVANFQRGLFISPACNRVVLNAMITELDDMGELFLSAREASAVDDPAVLYSAGLQAAQMLMNRSTTQQHPDLLANLAVLEKLTAVTPEDAFMRTIFLNMMRWAVSVSIILLMSTLMAYLATERIIDELDPHLPRPVFHRLSLMIRTVSWDIHQSLRKENKERQIEVIQVQRDDKTGGIKMHGILLDIPSNNVASNRQQREPDRHFWITTDDRARVTESQIKGYGSIGAQPEEIEPEIFVAREEGHSLRVRINRRLGWS